MLLKVIIEEQVYTLQVPEPLLTEASEFFEQLDRDMDPGWQMSREWVDAPDRLQRCQIVADKLLTALEKENQRLGLLMAAYLLSRLPDLEAVELDVHGEIQNNSFRLRPPAASDTRPATATAPAATLAAAPTGVPAMAPASAPTAPAADMPSGLGKIAAMTQAGHDVTKAFRVGKGWRFSVYDHATGAWQDSPLLATQAEAERLRQLAFRERYEALQRQP
ncbi:MAG: hypothetical protein EA400_07610 [Chromatiaceae bacterium]|nr:MAG: hypothetical protein EA400_07610 [Chromatiaceae bacterium]